MLDETVPSCIATSSRLFGRWMHLCSPSCLLSLSLDEDSGGGRTLGLARKTGCDWFARHRADGPHLQPTTEQDTLRFAKTLSTQWNYCERMPWTWKLRKYNSVNLYATASTSMESAETYNPWMNQDLVHTKMKTQSWICQIKWEYWVESRENMCFDVEELVLWAMSSMIGEIAVTKIGTVCDSELNESWCLPATWLAQLLSKT